MKIKVVRHPERDANGAYARKQVMAMAERLAARGVVDFEERYRRTTSRACAVCATGRRRGWRSPLASTATARRGCSTAPRGRSAARLAA
ncbi:MAG TPA: hypothetical protein VF469_02110 [Kofleriaceae bacterium]